VQLLSKAELESRLTRSDDTAIRIDPLLDKRQVGEVSIDLRLGYDFLVSINTRKSFINTTRDGDDFRPVSTYFNATRRELGDRFMLYPGQVVLTTTLEYVSLPGDCYADLLSRSSYNRLGLHMNTMFQPGYRGCLSAELFNHGNSAVELVVGSRIFQCRLFELQTATAYEGSGARKYLGNVRPVPSAAADDWDASKLRAIRRAHAH
jgi:dCTP deaminase